MEPKNKVLYENAVKDFEEKSNRKLNEQELKWLKDQYDNPVAHNVELRPKEIDIRELNKNEYRQLEDRNLRDINQRLNFIQSGVNDITMLICVLLKEVYKIDNPLESAEDFKTDMLEKFKKNQSEDLQKRLNEYKKS